MFSKERDISVFYGEITSEIYKAAEKGYKSAFFDFNVCIRYHDVS